MIEITGFASIPSLENNAVRSVAVVGEMSTYCKSFSRDLRTFQIPGNEVDLVTLYCKEDGVDYSPGASLAESILSLAEWIHDTAATRSKSQLQIELQEEIELAFPGKYASVLRGALVVADNGNIYPAWLEFQVRSVIKTHLIRVFFSDAAMRLNYGHSEIYPIPPLTSLDTFFSGFTAVSAALASATPAEALVRVQQKAGDIPYTSLESAQYDFVNPNVPTQKVSTTWLYVVYGPLGNDPDALREATQALIAKESKRAPADWKGIFPDIYASTELVFIPLWSNMAVPEQTLVAGVNSGVFTLSTALSYLKKHVQREAAFIDKNAQAFSHPYRNLGLLVLGSPDNRGGLTQFSQHYADFIAVSSTSADFSRMSAATRDFALKMAYALGFADTGKISVGEGYGRTSRWSMEFVTFNHNGVTHYVSTRESTPKE